MEVIFLKLKIVSIWNGKYVCACVYKFVRVQMSVAASDQACIPFSKGFPLCLMKQVSYLDWYQFI